MSPAHRKKTIPLPSNFSLLDHLTEGFYAIDKSWRFIYVNKQGARLAQMPAKKMIGKRALDLFPDAHAAEFGKAATKVMKDKRARTIEAYYPRYDKWYENNIYPIAEGVSIFARDITKRKQAETDQLRFVAIVTSADDAIVSKNLNSIIMSWNKAAERMFGYTAKEAIGKSVRMIIPPELQKEEDKILAQLKRGKRVEHFQTVRLTKSGKRIDVSLTISPIKDKSGIIIGASKIARDITQVKRIEHNLRFLAQASKELSKSLDYEKTLANVARFAVPSIAEWCGVDLLDKNGAIQQVAVVHVDPEKVAWAKKLRRERPPDMNASTGISRVLKTGKSELYSTITDTMLVAAAKTKKELAILRKLGMTSAMIVPLYTKGKPIGAISFVTSGLQRSYTEQDLVMAEEIANRASLAIENARLYEEVQKELSLRKSLEKQKDEFIGVASHELKTPVTSIKSYTQILTYKFRKEGNEKAAGLLGKLDAQIDKLTNLIGDLLDVTKIEAGRLLFNDDTFPFDEMVAEIMEELQRTTDKHVLRIEGKTGKIVRSDKERIGQVLTNLISNAIKYSPYAKEIIIHVSADSQSIKLCVQDFGVGIAKEKQDRVFERFFRVSGPGKETYPGLGLGLYISNEIIKRLQGKLWVESVEGKGSTFCFLLPLKQKRIVQNIQNAEAMADAAIRHE